MLLVLNRSIKIIMLNCILAILGSVPLDETVLTFRCAETNRIANHVADEVVMNAGDRTFNYRMKRRGSLFDTQ